jgi:FG-GAP repeat
VIGAYADDGAISDVGSAYVFTRSGGVWTEQAKLTPPGGVSGDFFGIAVAIDGDTIVVGASGDDGGAPDGGAAHVFTRSGSVWTHQAELLAAGGAVSNGFGRSVDLDADTAAIGAGTADPGGLVDAGAAYVFTRSAGTWTQQGALAAGDGAAGDVFGSAVSVSGDTLVSGAWRNDQMADDAGSAYVFERTAGVWTERTKLVGGDGAADDRFGVSVGIDGGTIVVGAYRDDDSGTNSGSAYLYVRSGANWTQGGKAVADDAAAGDQFGISVAVDGDTALIGAFTDDAPGSNSGSAYAFVFAL